MKLVAVLVLALLLAGCATVGTGGPSNWNERARCEAERGGGVWVEAAGACVRGGGGA